ncbi:MAG: thioredoxin domain-containing protein [Candidatus Campbellbacteria bacterium]|nr:thioredoxin domain-containing protein [Candidatus Campbellbacteria bacterium]
MEEIETKQKNKKTNAFVFFVVLIVIVFLLLFYSTEVSEDIAREQPTQPAQPTQPTPPTQRNSGYSNADSTDRFIEALVTIREYDHIRGNRNSEVSVIEYSDFQCPFCGRVHNTLIETVEESNGRVSWVYRHLPLTEIHPTATAASSVSECIAREKGNDEFWRFTDTLFLNGTISLSSRTQLVKDTERQFQISETTLNQCISDLAISDRIKADTNEAIRANIRGTPGLLLVNHTTKRYRLLPGAVSKEQLIRAIASL